MEEGEAGWEVGLIARRQDLTAVRICMLEDGL